MKKKFYSLTILENLPFGDDCHVPLYFESLDLAFNYVKDHEGLDLKSLSIDVLYMAVDRQERLE